MEVSNVTVSSFANVRENVSSTSLPSATRYHARVANSSRCSSNTIPHDVVLGVGLRDPDANEIAMMPLLALQWGGLSLIESRVVGWCCLANLKILPCLAGFGCSWLEAAEPSEGFVH